MGSENAHGCTQKAENGFGYYFSYSDTAKMATNFLSHIVRVTGDETWVSFVNAETKEQSKQWTAHIHKTSRKSLNRRLPARKLMATLFWNSKGVPMVEFMQQGTTMSEVYSEALKKTA
jgi:hypothetical protein